MNPDDLAYLVNEFGQLGVHTGPDNAGNLVIPSEELSKLRVAVERYLELEAAPS